MRAVIICGGNAGEYIKKNIQADDFIICADSGFDNAKRYGIAPNIVIGDMDSVKCSIDGENVEIYPTRKDYTDSELAIMYAKDRGYKEIIMLGMTGSRMDHTLTNLLLLKQLDGCNACIVDLNNEIYLVNSQISLKGKKGDLVSIIPFEKDVKITVKGLEYPLSGDVLKAGSSRGVSNVMTGENCTVSAEDGPVFVIRSRD